MLFDRFSFRERHEGLPDEESMGDLPTESRGYSFTLETRQIVFLIAGYCFLCVLVFALGVVVGRAIAEPEAVIDATGSRASVPSSPPLMARQEVPPVDRIPLIPDREPQNSLSNSPEFTFSPTLPGTLTTSREESQPTTPPSPPTMFPEAAPSSAPPPLASRLSEDRPEGELKRPATPEPRLGTSEAKVKAPPATRPSPSQGGEYAVQVSSFRSMDQASDLKSRLSKRGYTAYVQSVDLNDKGTWHRVRVGNYRDKDGAERVASDIRNRESLPAMVTRR